MLANHCNCSKTFEKINHRNCFQAPQPGQPTRLATAGSDTHVVIWGVKKEEEGEKVELYCLCDLTRCLLLPRFGKAKLWQCTLVRPHPSQNMKYQGWEFFVTVNKANDGHCHLIDLTCVRHQRAVNIVRWSPDGQLLASGDDESIIIIWKVVDAVETLLLNFVVCSDEGGEGEWRQPLWRWSRKQHRELDRLPDDQVGNLNYFCFKHNSTGVLVYKAI